MWRIMHWLDRGWLRWHARGTLGGDWMYRRPRLWTFTTVPLSTWLRHPRDGWESYRAHLGPILFDRETRQLTERKRGRRP
jgi:hypothetical protein